MAYGLGFSSNITSVCLSNLDQLMCYSANWGFFGCIVDVFVAKVAFLRLTLSNEYACEYLYPKLPKLFLVKTRTITYHLAGKPIYFVLRLYNVLI